MSKYNMRICGCGRIHMVNNGKINNALEHDKDLLLICGGCGKATLIGANIEPDWNDLNRNCYDMYSYDFSRGEDHSITISNFESTNLKGIEEIFYSNGLKVPMMTGMYANHFSYGKFSDMIYPDFYKIRRKDVTVQEIMDFINEYSHDRTTVNMQRFINENPKDMLDEISGYYIESFDWRGTKWERKWK